LLLNEIVNGFVLQLFLPLPCHAHPSASLRNVERGNLICINLCVKEKSFFRVISLDVFPLNRRPSELIKGNLSELFASPARGIVAERVFAFYR
jgi:hypothetical protein